MTCFRPWPRSTKSHSAYGPGKAPAAGQLHLERQLTPRPEETSSHHADDTESASSDEDDVSRAGVQKNVALIPAAPTNQPVPRFANKDAQSESSSAGEPAEGAELYGFQSQLGLEFGETLIGTRRQLALCLAALCVRHLPAGQLLEAQVWQVVGDHVAMGDLDIVTLARQALEVACQLGGLALVGEDG